MTNPRNLGGGVLALGNGSLAGRFTLEKTQFYFLESFCYCDWLPYRSRQIEIDILIVI